MAKAFVVVRAEVPEPERARFDHWYDTDHLPWALRAFEARRAWRCWSRADRAVHVGEGERLNIVLQAGERLTIGRMQKVGARGKNLP